MKKELTKKDIPDIKANCPYCQEEQKINYKHIQMFYNDKQDQQCKSCNKDFGWKIRLLGVGSVEIFKQEASDE